LLGLGHFFSFLNFLQSVGVLGQGIIPSQGCYLHTEQHKHGINAHRHPCLKWNSNPQSQCFEAAKAVHALGRVATVTGTYTIYQLLQMLYNDFLLLPWNISTHSQCMVTLFSLVTFFSNECRILTHFKMFISANSSAECILVRHFLWVI
jgi:hypothetical protein